MRPWLRKCWPALKALFTVAILGFVGRQFAHDLSRVDISDRSVGVGWLILSGVLYLAGLGMSAYFWIRLLRLLGQEPRPLQAVRAYYLGHLGKYLPGKAWALFLRAALARSEKVRGAVAGLTAFYEVLTTMASGVLVAAILFGVMGLEASDPPDWSALRWLLRMQEPGTTGLDPRLLALLSLALAAVVGLPIIPWVFNGYARRISVPLQEATDQPIPRLGVAALLQGLVLTAGGWFLLGASLWAVIQGLAGGTQPLTWPCWGNYTAILSLAYVVGFAVLLVPNGLGVREFFLTVLLVPGLVQPFHLTEEQARATAVLAVLVLRLVWTAAELVLAAVIYWLPGPTDA
jgi:hypothetical protein